MDEKRDGMVDWDELLSRLLIELQTKDRVISHKEIRRTALNDSPNFISSHHRHPISRIHFYPELKQVFTLEAPKLIKTTVNLPYGDQCTHLGTTHIYLYTARDGTRVDFVYMPN
ncbi:hypothetical protein J437_LFUL011353 [Ladona fulva]|uniref:Uncharacterized protein n=1 Tax=Ladona fulva TaxID=123851 RepID=A0A8K0KAW8_LADFU|nr:hypothetical protein J437_LFUL011353 [Ladona fulva]